MSHWIRGRLPPISHARPLFDAASTLTHCPHCGLPADSQQRCGWELDRAEDEPAPRRRPTECIRAHDPATAPLPEGY